MIIKRRKREERERESQRERENTVGIANITLNVQNGRPDYLLPFSRGNAKKNNRLGNTRNQNHQGSLSYKAQ